MMAAIIAVWMACAYVVVEDIDVSGWVSGLATIYVITGPPMIVFALDHYKWWEKKMRKEVKPTVVH